MINNRILKSIQVEYFKSIGKTTIEIPSLAVFVGKNAAGKSNIVSVFKFLKDLADKGLSYAVQQQGGMDILFNALTKDKQKIEIKIELDLVQNLPFAINLSPTIDEEHEHFPLQLAGKASKIVHTMTIIPVLNDYSLEESFTISCYYGTYFPYQFPSTDLLMKYKDLDTVSGQKNTIVVSTDDESMLMYSTELLWNESNYNFYRASINKDSAYYSTLVKDSTYKISSPIVFGFNDLSARSNIYPKETYLQLEPIFGQYLKNLYSSFKIYEFIPKSIKTAIHTTGNDTLDGDGGNMNIILQSILLDESRRRIFMNLVRYVLPFIKDIEIQVPRNGLAIPVIHEEEIENFRLPAEFFSDGTATVIAIIIALFFEDNSITIIEEPERYVHPAIMDKLATLFEDASRNKQVIVTTHSPDLIRHLQPTNVQLVSRDKDHFTHVRRVSEDAEIKSFLDGEMQLDDLMINNFFED